MRIPVSLKHRALLLGNRKRPFLPAFLSVRLLGAAGIIWIISLCFRVHWWLGLYLLLCAGITLLHAALRKVEDKSRDTYEESMLLISVNGDKNDEEDRYLNGYSTLHMKKQFPVSNKHSLKLLSLNDLHHVFIAQLVVQTHALRLVLHRRAPHPRVLELPRNILVQTVAEVSHRGVLRVQNHRLLVIGNLTLPINPQK